MKQEINISVFAKTGFFRRVLQTHFRLKNFMLMKIGFN